MKTEEQIEREKQERTERITTPITPETVEEARQALLRHYCGGLNEIEINALTMLQSYSGYTPDEFAEDVMKHHTPLIAALANVALGMMSSIDKIIRKLEGEDAR